MTNESDPQTDLGYEQIRAFLNDIDKRPLDFSERFEEASKQAYFLMREMYLRTAALSEHALQHGSIGAGASFAQNAGSMDAARTVWVAAMDALIDNLEHFKNQNLATLLKPHMREWKGDDSGD